ncbi:MAG: hypothetical protein WKH64_16445, partial [Chloroflexia bacterium]
VPFLASTVAVLIFSYRLAGRELAGSAPPKNLGKMVWQAIVDHPLVGLLVALLLLVGSLYYLRLRYQNQRGIKMLPWVSIATCTVGVLALISVCTWLLLRQAELAPSGQQAQLRSDAIKTAVTLLAGSAGGGALILTFKNHFNGEMDRPNSQFEQAAGKLADESAVIQYAAVKTLQRLAIKQAAFRISVVDVLELYTNSGSASETVGRYAEQVWLQMAPTGRF